MEAHGIHPHIFAGPSAANALWVTRERISLAGTDHRNPFLFPAGVAIQCGSRHACSRTDAVWVDDGSISFRLVFKHAKVKPAQDKEIHPVAQGVAAGFQVDLRIEIGLAAAGVDAVLGNYRAVPGVVRACAQAVGSHPKIGVIRHRLPHQRVQRGVVKIPSAPMHVSRGLYAKTT